MSSGDAAGVRERFQQAVNMTAGQLEKWLATQESKATGPHKDGGESTGHESGRRIVTLLRTKAADLTDADRQHMAKVAAFADELGTRPAEGLTACSVLTAAGRTNAPSRH